MCEQRDLRATRKKPTIRNMKQTGMRKKDGQWERDREEREGVRREMSPVESGPAMRRSNQHEGHTEANHNLDDETRRHRTTVRRWSVLDGCHGEMQERVSADDVRQC